ncbi:MAG: formimidoylglutamate deiminase [Pirellulaceae bacterium]
MQFESALVDGVWKQHVEFVFENGRIKAIRADADPQRSLKQVALPGMVNCHSHAFQRAFAGLSEFRTAAQDSFWTWRTLMYEFLLKLGPEDVYRIARQLYTEMLVAGYTSVGEFHYVHNDVDGESYANPFELTDAIVRAAEETGIRLCLLPVLYQRGGFQNQELVGGQKRFFLSCDRFVELAKYCQNLASGSEQIVAGMAIHSLRAVDPRLANEVLAELSGDHETFPIHIHVAEQIPEVEACLAAHNRRSVEYLFDQFEVNESWCLIHSTHLNDNELQRIAKSQAVVGLCPTTEANLGDGIFRSSEFLKAGGRFAIGSDSHVSVDLREELRLMEYGQRLLSRQRAVLGSESQSVGRTLYSGAASGGASALGLGRGRIAVGELADFTVVDPKAPAIDNAMEDRLLDRLVFCNVGNPIAGVVVGGKYIESPK